MVELRVRRDPWAWRHISITWPSSADLGFLESLFSSTMQGELRHDFQDLRKHLICPSLPPDAPQAPDGPPSRVDPTWRLPYMGVGRDYMRTIRLQ